MAYLVDELEAQQVVLGLIPDVLWDARPPGSTTLREMYRAMASREADEHRTALGLEPVEFPSSDTPADLLRQVGALRKRTLQELRATALDSERLDVCYRITQADAAQLREVGLRLNEAAMGAPRVSKM